jgi:hypothetical protein
LPELVNTLDDLKNIPICSTLSAPFLEQNLGDLFKRGSGPLETLLEERTGKIALSIFGPLYENRFHGCAEMYKVPKNIKEALEREAGCEFRIEGDAVSWGLGALQYLSLKSEAIVFPSVAITLGTHPGVAFIESEAQITSLEFWPEYYDFPKMQLATEVRPAYHVLSKGYLDTIAGGEERLDEHMKGYSPTFNQHFQAFTEDLSALIEKLFSKKIASILVGGGHSRFIAPAQDRIVLSPQALSEEGIAPDMLQLLGCRRSEAATATYPPFEELTRLLNRTDL